MTPPILLVATDEPFWRKSTGAWQRIAALSGFFSANGMDVHVFFPGKLTEKDAGIIRETRLTVHDVFSDTQPRGILKRAAWHAAGTVHMMKSWLKSEADQSGAERPLTLDDFRWPWAINQFNHLVSELNPQFLLIEYVKMAHLLEGLKPPQRTHICAMIDTHDLLYRRAQQFEEHGFHHWLHISRKEEAAVLQKFDVVVAIQEDEAAEMRIMAPGVKTIVAGHSLQQLSPPSQFDEGTAGHRDGSTPQFTVGYFGSTNFSNWSAITQFLENVWRKLVVVRPEAQLLIAGRICDWLSSPDEHPTEFPSIAEFENVSLAGFVDSLADFYKQVDVVVNPVQFGTGKKIKNCEALWFGRPLITTPAGSAAMPVPESTDQVSIVQVCENDQQMLNAIDELASAPGLLKTLKRQAFETGRSLFSDQHAYRELKAVINATDRT